jgi:hypothetical protein
MLEVDNSDIKTSSWGARVVVMIALLVFAYICLIMEPDDFKRSLTDEIHQIENTLGKKGAVTIIGRAKGWYRTSFETTGIAGFLNTLSQDTGLKGDSYWRTPMSRIGSNLKLVWYQVCLRASVSWFWLFLIAPLLIASLADGFYTRKIKQHEFSLSSTGYFRMSYWLVFIGIIGVKLYFIIPSAGLMNPLFPLIIAIAIAILSRNLISNSSKIM